MALESFNKEMPVSYIVDYLKRRTPSDTEFYLNFQNRDFTRSAQTKYILEMIENALTNNTREKTISGRSDVHIEHIMPRELLRERNKVIENSWQKELGTRASEYSMFVNRIGNLTLLGSELNITASNYPFIEKKKKYEQSIIMLTKEICQEDKWTFEEINIRSVYLAGIAKKIWNFNNLDLK
ncbi:HNH endonuclease family protein [Peribacillus simplex]|uniref:HNH endonuclease family protein n=1 Tax=Peribacillus simplex TaxID=1478 RepID=UPI0024C1C049|nr:HNH endonuclease family protein [Peribacillus simplex]WHY54641.1 HNH endonuclease family protein [Peribacillus simplex]